MTKFFEIKKANNLSKNIKKINDNSADLCIGDEHGLKRYNKKNIFFASEENLMKREEIITNNMLDSGDFMMISGNQSLFRMEFLIRMSCNFSVGKSFLNLQVKRPLNVLYLQYMDQISMLDKLFQKAQISLDEEITKLAVVKSTIFDLHKDFSNPDRFIKKIKLFLDERFAGEKVDLIIFDSITDLLLHDKVNDLETRNTLQKLQNTINPDSGVIIVNSLTQKTLRVHLENPHSSPYYSIKMNMFAKSSITILHFPPSNKIHVFIKNNHKKESSFVIEDNFEYNPDVNKEELFDNGDVRGKILEIMIAEGKKGKLFYQSTFWKNNQSNFENVSRNTMDEIISQMLKDNFIKLLSNKGRYKKVVPACYIKSNGYLYVPGMEYIKGRTTVIIDA